LLTGGNWWGWEEVTDSKKTSSRWRWWIRRACRSADWANAKEGGWETGKRWSFIQWFTSLLYKYNSPSLLNVGFRELELRDEKKHVLYKNFQIARPEFAMIFFLSSLQIEIFFTKFIRSMDSKDWSPISQALVERRKKSTFCISIFK
jgi:hypothetical protein